jgi:hypothetical protein
MAGTVLRSIIPAAASSKLKLRLLELRVASASGVPNSQDANSSVPVVVKDSDRAVLSNQVDFTGGTTDKLAVIREVADSQCGEIHVFTEDEHIIVTV